MESGNVELVLGVELQEDISRRFGRVVFIRYKSFDGLEIPTFIVESAIAPKRGPTIIYVHGGPWSEVADYWNTFIASLVAMGYHVVAPNFRGCFIFNNTFKYS